MSFNTIPAFSMPDIEQRDADTIAELKLALTTHGFFTITDHGIADDVLQSSYRLSKEFFLLSDAIKNTYAHPEKAGARGYTPFGKETAVGETTPDLKEFWHHGPLVDNTYDLRIHKNIEVDEVNQFNITFDKLFNELNNLAINVLSCIGITIGLNKDYFYPWVNKGNSLLRMIHYPPTNNTNIYRAREHADINLITLLIGAQEKGLEVKNKDNTWIKITADKNDIVCNIGDMLQLVTEGKLKSTPHRVVKYKDEEAKSRYSIPFFLHPSPDIMLKSVFDSSDIGVLAHDFLDERLKAIKLY